jgi:hypothetical protein
MVGTATIATQPEILCMSSLSATEARASPACRIKFSTSSKEATASRASVWWSASSRK